MDKKDERVNGAGGIKDEKLKEQQYKEEYDKSIESSPA